MGPSVIPARHGQMLRKMILALTSPTRSTASPDQPDLPAPVRDGIAFTSWDDDTGAPPQDVPLPPIYGPTADEGL